MRYAAEMILETRRRRPRSSKTASCSAARRPAKGSIIDPGDEVDELLDAATPARPDDHDDPADARAPRSHHRRRAGEGGARRPGLAAPGRQLPLRAGRAAGPDVRLARASRSRPSIIFYEGEGRCGSGATKCACAHARPLSRRSLPGGRGTRRRSDVDALRRRHALCRLDRPHRSARRRHATLLRLDPRGALFVSRTTRSSGPATASRRPIGRERRTNPFLTLIARSRLILVDRRQLDPADAEAVAALQRSRASSRSPLTKVPLVLSRSTTSSSVAPAVSRQCSRDTSAASTMKSARGGAADRLDAARQDAEHERRSAPLSGLEHPHLQVTLPRPAGPDSRVDDVAVARQQRLPRDLVVRSSSSAALLAPSLPSRCERNVVMFFEYIWLAW